jgi:hypothetical protein
MSEAYKHNDVSVLAATLSPEHAETAPLLHNKCGEAHTTIFECDRHAESDDEESQCGFWGEDAPFYDSETHSFWSKSTVPVKGKHRSLHDTICFWSATAMSLLTSFLLCWALISNFSQYEFNFRTAKWSTNHSAPMASSQHEVRHSILPISKVARFLTNELAQLRFCLTAPNREAPTAQKWQYLPPSDPFDCTTEIITLSADSSNYWKVHTSDSIILGDPSQPSISPDGGASFTGLQAKIRALELGDDLAEEGNVSDYVG